MNFARSLLTVSGFTMISRIAGFIRDTLTATFLGAGPIADAFFVAQRLPNLFRSLFAEGAFTSAFVPLYTAESEKKGDAAAQAFAGEALSLLIATLIPFTALAVLAMPYLIYIVAPGFQNEAGKYEMAVKFSRITFPYLALISITALQGGVLNAHHRFGPPAAAPIALNIVMILGLLSVAVFGLPAGETLSWSLLASGVVQASWLALSCKRAGLTVPLLRPRLTEAGKRLFRQIGPGALGAGAMQVNLFLSTILASLLPTGAVSFLYYADRLNQLPLGIVGIAIATTLLPILSRQVTAGKKDSIRHYTSRAIEFSLLLGLPAAIGLACAGEAIVCVLFQHGAFTAGDTHETAKALTAYATGIPAFFLVKIFATNFFARQDVRTPLRFSLVSIGLDMSLSVLFLFLIGHPGIALGTSLATWANAAQLFLRLKKNGEELYDAKLLYRLPRFLASSAGMAAVTMGANAYFEPMILTGTFVHRLGGLAAILGLSALSYAIFLQLTKAFSLQEALSLIKPQKEA